MRFSPCCLIIEILQNKSRMTLLPHIHFNEYNFKPVRTLQYYSYCRGFVKIKLILNVNEFTK